MKLSHRRLPKRRSTKRCSIKPRFEVLESRQLLSGTQLPFDDSGLAPANLQAVCALPNLPVFNVHNYGAVGNGVADDTVAIRAALSAAEANGGGIIYLPTGTYAVDPQASDSVAWGAIFTITSSNIVFIGDHDPLTGASETHLKGYVEGLKDPVTNWYVTGDSYQKIGRFSMFSIDSSLSQGPISNVQFRSLDINGDAPYTGNSEVGGDPATGDGWDMNHKGIRMDGANSIHGVLVFNSNLENWRGEEIYSGGNDRSLDVINCRIVGSNASAVSCSAILLLDNVTIGGSGANAVYNGIENLSLIGQSTTIANCTIQDAGNGLSIEGQDNSTFLSITGTSFTNCTHGILFQDADHNVTIDNCTFTGCTHAMLQSELELYAFVTPGYSNFTISNCTFDCTNGFTSQGGAYSGGLTFENITVLSGNLLNGSFSNLDLAGGFTVSNCNLIGGGAAGFDYAGKAALWSNTTWAPLNTPSIQYWSGTPLSSYGGGTSGNAVFYSDRTFFLTNDSPGNFYATLDPATLSNYPVGFTTTLYPIEGSNWYLKANSSWNTFSSDLPIGPDGLTIRVNPQGLFEVVDRSARTATTTAVTSSASSSVFDQAITLTATVTGTTPGANIPTGSVTFYDGSAILGTSTLNSTGTATWTTSALAVGSHTITAAYGGDGNFAASTGNLKQTVSQASTTTLLTSSTGSSVFGQSVTFTATVITNASGSGIPTGTVTFLDGNTLLGTGTLGSNGQATFSTSKFGAGNHTITVSYGGSANFAASTGNLTQTVSQASTTTSLTSSTGSSVFGQSVTFTANVSPNASGSGIPTGTVTFLDGSITLGTVALDTTGKATFSTAALNLGGHAISVIYSGDANFTTSAGQVSQSVKQATTSTSPTATVAPLCPAPAHWQLRRASAPRRP